MTSVYLFEVGNPNALASKSISIGRYPVDTALSFSLSTELVPGNHQLYVSASSYEGVSGDSPIFSINVAGPQNQTISFNSIGTQTYGGAWPALSASASSGLPVEFASLTPLACGISGGSVSLLAAGTCTITADQSGNGSFYPAPQVSQSFTIAKANQVITLSGPSSGLVGTSATLSASASSGLPVTLNSTTPGVCTLSASTANLVGAGTCTITANQAGDGNINAAAQVSSSFTVSRNAQSISFGALASKTFGDPAFGVSASATSGLAVSFSAAGPCTVSGTTVTITGAGNCTITASQAGDTTWSPAAPVSQLFNIAKKAQSISFAAMPPLPVGTAQPLSASTSSGLPVVYSSATTGICTVSGNVASLQSIGTCIVNANQAGDGNYLAASQVQQSIVVGSSYTPVAINIAVPQESNPEGGTLPGNLGVSSGGAATYSIPIQLPPGIAGMQPSISLNYDSGNTSGSAGLGWSVGGLSSIDRCGKVFATDIKTDGVHFTTADRLCLDGQRLVLVNGDGSQDAAYWASDAKYRTEIESYTLVTTIVVNQKRTFLVESKGGRKAWYGETPDSYIEGVGRNDQLPHRWAIDKAADASGNYITYTYTENATTGEVRPANVSWGGNSVRGTPHFAKVAFTFENRPDPRNKYVAGSRFDERLRLKTIQTTVDQSDNSSGSWVNALTYTLNYTVSASSGRSLLQSVAACDAQKCLPSTTFNWGARDPSATQGFVALGGVRTGPDLDKMATETSHGQRETFIAADFNGDGRTDIFERYRGTSNVTQHLYEMSTDGATWNVYTPFASSPEIRSLLDAADYDGDGKLDLLVADTSNKLRICPGRLRSGSSYSCALAVGIPPTIQAEVTNVSIHVTRDFNSDSKDDLFLRTGVQGSPNYHSYQCLSNGTGFICSEVTGTRDEVDMGSVLYAEPPRVNAFADVDGDGRVDTIVIPHCQFGLHDVETTRKWYCTSTGFGAGDEASGIISYNTPESGGAYFGGDIYQLPDLQTAIVPALRDATLLSDFNGDGYSDMVVGTKGLSNTDLSEGKGLLCLSRGDGFTDCLALPKTGFVNGTNRNHLALAIGDFDGDGVVDILRPLEDTWVSGATNVTQGYQLCHIGTDTTASTDPLPLFQRCQAWSGPIFYTMGQHSIYDGADGGMLGRNSMFAGDFNGDGRQDIATYLGGNQWQFHTAANQSKPGEALDKLISVTNGVGLFEKVSYALANDATVYSPTATNPDGTAISTGKLTYPGQQLVKTLDRSNGRGGMLTTSYKYFRQAMDKGGRGSLGFARVESTDVQSGVVTTNWPWLDFPHIGATHYAQVKTGSCILSDTSETRTPVKLYMGSTVSTDYSYVSQSVVVRKDLNCADLGKTTTTNGNPDAYGNIQTSTTTSTSNINTGGYTVVKGMKYDNVSFPTRVGELRELTDTRTNNTGTLSRINSYTYDGIGLLKTELRQGDLTTQLLTTYNRDGFGNVTQTIVTWRDPVSNTDKNRTVADVTPTANGRFPNTVKNALGQVETKTFDARSGAPKSVTTANALTMTWDSDGFGRKTRAVAADGTETITMLKNCAANCPAGATTVAIQQTKRGAAQVAVPVLVFADSAGHALRSLTWGFDGTKIATDNLYDSRGRATDSYWPRFVTDAESLADALSPAAGAKLSKRVEYDDLNRVTKVITPDEQGALQTTTTTYSGFTITVQNPKGNTKADTRDVWGKLANSQDANSKYTYYEHDAFGNLSKTTDPLNNVVVVKYDQWGRRTELNDPDMGKISYSVDPLGQVWLQVSAKQLAAGKATTMQYDDLGRMISRIAQDATTSHSAVWVFDKRAGQSDCTSFRGCGQLVEAYTLLSDGVTKDNRRVMSFDALGRPSMTTYYRDVAYNSTTEYDAWGRPSKVTHVCGSGTAKVFGQFYNGFGQLSRIERQGAALWTATTMDAAQRLRAATLGNGLKVTRDYYDYTGRLKAGQLLNTSNAEVLKEGYNYDALGNVSLRTQAWLGQTFNELFDYDSLNRLKLSTLGSDTQNFVYDDIGNILTKTNVGGNATYAYNAPGPLGVGKRPHAVSAIPNVGSFAYDENGNMTSGAGRTMTWTAFDMPVSITMGAESSSFVYGPDYERTVQNKADTTRIYYAGAMEVETKGSNTTVKTYWPANLGVEIEKAGATTLNYTHVDRLGSVVAITDGAGNLVEKLAFDSWGKRRNLFDAGTPATIDGVTDNKGYTGHEMLDQVDLVHMNGRVYDPLVARFLSADPYIQDPTHSQSFNRYSYVWNNPTNMTDPSGFRSLIPCNQDSSCHIDASGNEVGCRKGGKIDPTCGGGDENPSSPAQNDSASHSNSKDPSAGVGAANKPVITIVAGNAAPPGGTVGAETAESILAKFDSLPEPYKRRFRALGNQLIIVPDSVADAFPSLANVTAPGWGKVTWAYIPGGYIDFPVEEYGWKSPKALVVSLSGKYKHGTADLFYHEFGHSIDHGGELSSKPLFDIARRRDFYGRNDINPYFKGDPKEHFAEGVARYLKRDKTLKDDWPETFDYMKNLSKCLSSKGGCQ